MKISMIAAMDAEGGLGRNHQMAWHVPDDLKHFKALTLGKPVVMGRTTYESLPKKPLPGRLNVVLSRTTVPQQDPQVVWVASLEEAWHRCAAQHAQEVMVIGGAHVYAQVLPQCDVLYLTRLVKTFGCDVFFPAWNPLAWTCVEQTWHYSHDHAMDYAFEVWQRKEVDHELGVFAGAHARSTA